MKTAPCPILRRAAIGLLLAIGQADLAPAQVPNLRKVKDAVKKVTRTVDTVTSTARTAGQAAALVGASVWDDFDFVPGNKALFYTDFSEERLGSFPQRLHFIRGSMDVVERGGGRMLRATAKSEFVIPIGTALPDRFTLEIDVVAPSTYCCLDGVVLFEGGTVVDQGRYSADISWAPHGAWINGSGMNRANSPVAIPEEEQPSLRGTVAHVRVVMDGSAFKLFSNGRRLFSMPELEFKRDTAIRVVLHGSSEPGMAAYLTGIRIAESTGAGLAEALAGTGRWSTLGLLFERTKARLREESAPVLRDVAALLTEQPDLRIRIEAHTDNTGDAATNLTLSQERAEAIRGVLVSRFGIEAERIVAQGLGDTQPVVPNNTPEGRAQNRRVEVVRQ